MFRGDGGVRGCLNPPQRRAEVPHVVVWEAVRSLEMGLVFQYLGWRVGWVGGGGG